MDLALGGKRAIITGGTGGIGIAIARHLALEGVRTAVCSRSLQRAADAIAALGLDRDAELMPVQVELKDPASVTAMVAAVAERWGGVDIVVNLTKALSRELGRDGITVNAVHPFTTMTGNLGPRLQRMAERRDVAADQHLQALSARTSLGRLVTADEIADFVTFLASPRSVALTGEVLALTGGLGTAVYF
jgi:NAD(P)-dependent dehydrogenase (short-subunit alcohol dehydrogenase family)